MAQPNPSPTHQSQAPQSQGQRLICVYNADTGLIEMLKHAVHKAFRPATYPCSLCAMTYGAVSMRGDWKEYWQSLDAEVLFYHRDDFTADFPKYGTGGADEVALPVIMFDEPDAEMRVLVSNEELDAMADVEELMARLNKELGAVRADLQMAV